MKNFETFMVEKKFDEKEAQELKTIYNHYLYKRKEIMKKISFRVEDVFVDVIKKVISVKNK